MTLVLDGIRVLEVAEYGFVPSAASVLGEWGADVIKVEHAVRGDAQRGLSSFGVKPGQDGFTVLWEPFNRSKRSIAVNIAVPEGRDIILELASRADVFLTASCPRPGASSALRSPTFARPTWTSSTPGAAPTARRGPRPRSAASTRCPTGCAPASARPPPWASRPSCSSPPPGSATSRAA